MSSARPLSSKRDNAGGKRGEKNSWPIKMQWLRIVPFSHDAPKPSFLACNSNLTLTHQSWNFSYNQQEIFKRWNRWRKNFQKMLTSSSISLLPRSSLSKHDRKENDLTRKNIEFHEWEWKWIARNMIWWFLQIDKTQGGNWDMVRYDKWQNNLLWQKFNDIFSHL